MDGLLERGTGSETIFSPHKLPERASILKEALGNQVDKVACCPEVSFFPQHPGSCSVRPRTKQPWWQGQGLFAVWKAE